MASSKFDFNELQKALRDNFPNSILQGTTTTGEISPIGIKDDTISTLIVPRNYAKATSFVLPNIAPGEAPIQHWKNIILGNGVIINFSTGLNGGEENALSAIETIFENNNVELIGGSAGDNLKFKETNVCLNENIFSNASIGTLLNIDKSKFNIYKENIYTPTEKYLQATKVDVEKRIVYEFDGQKASTTYAKALGIKESELKDAFFNNPLGLKMGKDIIIRSAHTLYPDGSIGFYSQIEYGSILGILESGNTKEIFQNTINQIQNDFKRVDGVFIVNCILRKLKFETESLGDIFCQNFKQLTPNITGFCSYGEQIGNKEFGWLHINQTATIIVFGQK